MFKFIISFLLLSLHWSGVLLAQDYSQFFCDVKVDNEMIQMPFSGGLNTPQVSSTDFNFDGKQDLLLFDKSGNVAIPLINVGGVNEAKYKYDLAYASYIPNVRGLLLLRDFNKDGIEDIFTFHNVGSTLNVFKGKRVMDHIEYEQFEFNIPNYLGLFYRNGADTSEIYVAPGDVPAIIDMDNDGDLDILSFEGGGEVINYFKNISVERGYGLDTLIFELDNRCWGSMRRSTGANAVILSDEMGICPDQNFKGEDISSSRHAGAGTFCVFDENGDGLQDVILGDDQTGTMILVKNGGTLEEAWIVAQDTTFPSYNIPFNMPLFASAYYVDIDNDGKRDMLGSTNGTSLSKNYENIQFYKNIGTDDNPLFEQQVESVLVDDILDFGAYSSPCFVDENADGLLDIIVGNYGYKDGISGAVVRLALLRNVGTPQSPKFVLENKNYLDFDQFKADFSEHLAPTFGDLDNDGDMDLVIGDLKGKLYYLENIAGINEPLAFADAVYPYMDIDIGKLAKPSIVDINQDGLMDLVIGISNSNISNGVKGCFNYFENQGTASEAFFNNNENTYPNNPILGAVDFQDESYTFPKSAPCFVTIADDLLLFSGSAAGYIKMYNGIVGNQEEFHTVSEQLGGIDVGDNSTIAVADIDNDGYFEFLMGNRRGGLNFINSPVKISGEISAVVENERERIIHIYPNPFTDNISIESEINILKVRVYAATGQLVKEIDDINNIPSIGLMDIENGVYIIQLTTVDNRVVSKKLIKY